MSLATIAGLPINKVTEHPPFFNMLVYGESGVGKTTLAGSADEVAEMRKVLIIDIEGGTLSIRKKFPNVEVVRVKNWPDLQLVYDELYAGLHDFSTIIIDSLTECQKMSMDAVMKKLVNQYEDRDPDVPGIREWNINIEQTRKFVRLFRDLPMNTIFTTLCKTDKNMNTGAIRRKPSLSGKVADEVAGFLDIVTYLYTKEEPSNPGHYIRVLLCGNTESEVAKDRTDLLPLTIPNPTMNVIWNAVKGIKTNEQPA